MSQFVIIESWQEIRGKNCLIVLETRPSYFNRGRVIAKLFVNPGQEDLCYIDSADMWPRYYFDEDRAKAEILAWMKVNNQLMEEKG